MLSGSDVSFANSVARRSRFLRSPIYRDNRATLALLKNRQYHSRTKPIALRENFAMERTDSLELSPI